MTIRRRIKFGCLRMEMWSADIPVTEKTKRVEED
jgi:hypothetical protein